ncbi:acrylate utilization transcriptional regulator AcuR [Neoaquamicrobium sediminum]|uniref:acrylate utilization transcriptional regulator AcuR n=1 Tax=Neoaquamicrobium sediminum TaxID=1849104 RepID=UPI001563814D|nr:TetR/AcrR family transcriptional regulator [Mesorhizobium sediminum]NRC57354.1 TetR family transcriptional regulator [Mesorhizobium sediminum]
MSESATVVRKRGRPRKDPSLPGSARSQLLRTGVAILTEKGFSAVGIEEMLSAASVPKGSFYHYFDSKDDFGLALIDAYADYFARKLDRWLEASERPPLQRLEDFVADAREGMARHHFRRGCLVGNLGQEMGVLPERFRQRIAAVFADWEARTEKCLRAAQAAGQIPREADCEQLASFFWIGWEGAVLRAKLERNADALDAFSDGFFKLLGTRPDTIDG